MEIIIKIQRAFIILYLIFLNIFCVFKTIEYAIPSKPEKHIYDFDQFGGYFVPAAFGFLIVIIFILFIAKDYDQKFKDFLGVLLNMGLVFCFCFNYNMLSFVGLVLAVLAIILLFILHLKKN